VTLRVDDATRFALCLPATKRGRYNKLIGGD
jgi:hypothetical protein